MFFASLLRSFTVRVLDARPWLTESLLVFDGDIDVAIAVYSKRLCLVEPSTNMPHTVHLQASNRNLIPTRTIDAS